ncbi:unnamed protein product [Spodoptera exigua]|nr:unnamed protein product [Spodoptera exigua]
MTSLIDKIEQLIKREKTTPERKKDDSKKSSSEILSELFSAFNADPPKIDEIPSKKSKKSKKKHKKEKKKRSRSSSSDSSDDSEYTHKRKKRKKSKSKKRARESRSPSYPYPLTPVRVKPENDQVTIKQEKEIKLEDVKPKEVKLEKDVKKHVAVKVEDESISLSPPHPMPMSIDSKKPVDLREKLDEKKVEVCNADNDKSKGKIQIKNLKFSAVYEETVKKAEEEARKKAEKYEEGEYTDSSSSTEKEIVCNSQFPKTSDPGGILKKQAEEESSKIEINGDSKSAAKKSKKSESSSKSSRRDRSKTPKRSRSKSRRSSSTSRKRHHRSSSKTRRSSRSRHRSSSRSRRRSRSRSRRRSRSRSRHRTRRLSPRHGRRRSRSPTGVKLADSEKKRLLEVARRNAINMLKNGAVPAGAAALPPHTRNQVMAAIQSGGKSVDELTDFCKHLSKKEALGELSSVSSNDDDMSENEDTLAFHHPFLVKEKAPIVMNIRGGAPLPIKTNPLPIANKEELRLQFPVSSGSQHREKASEWVPVSPPKKDMQVAKLNSTSSKTKSITASTPSTTNTCTEIAKISERSLSPPAYMKSFTSGSQLNSVPAIPALPAPGPQAYPPGVDAQKMQDVALIVSQKLSLIRKEQEENELFTTHGFGWSAGESSLGQFTGSTGAQILTPRELASGTQAWAKKVQINISNFNIILYNVFLVKLFFHFYQKMYFYTWRCVWRFSLFALRRLFPCLK